MPGEGRQYIDGLANYALWRMLTRWNRKQREEIRVGVVRCLDQIVKGGPSGRLSKGPKEEKEPWRHAEECSR